MVRISGKRGHKLQTKWKGPLRVIETKLPLLFVIEVINRSHQITAHAQRLVLYPVLSSARHQQASNELM